MRHPVLPILLALAGCAAAADGQWPSLARRPGETENTASVAAAAPAAEPAAPTGDASAAAVASGRTADIAREFADVETRWQRQRGVTETAVAAARRAPPSDPAWPKGQLELTRLERIGAEIAELRDRADAVAGDLAQAAAAGSDTRPAIEGIGALIMRIETARVAHLQAFETAQRSLAR